MKRLYTPRNYVDNPLLSRFRYGTKKLVYKDGRLIPRQQGIPLKEITVNGYAPIRLTTYYPLQSKLYPYTGHSKLDIPIDYATWESYTGEDETDGFRKRVGPHIVIDKDSRSSDYNLFTNNCADATLCFLNSVYKTNESPFLFTTPGDVRDYAINKLNGKLVKNADGSDTVLIPRTRDNYKQISSAALKFYEDAPRHTSYYIYRQ